MRFRSLAITNFRAISRFEVENLGDLVVIAGPNGAGKSGVLDAIRLLKSVYGGYQYDEWRQWYAEFNINLDRPEDVRRLFRDPEKAIVVDAELEFSAEEREYVAANAERLVEWLVWRTFLGRDPGPLGGGSTPMELRDYEPRVAQLTEEGVDALRKDLEREVHALRVEISPGGRTHLEKAPLSEVVFPTYLPQHLGVIDYHSASRSYQRETVGTVQLNLTSQDEQRRQSAAFFPDKQFLGAKPDANGSLSFPVRLATGEVHDIDDLSSGEKEIVYGYLRLRNSAPRHSVVLLDEPELHLNPALLRAMPDFYYRHLGIAMDNQIWFVTHSDALLREAVGHPHFSVFHMSNAETDDGLNQAREVVEDDDLERATMALVGDLATYKPRAKLVILEGGGDTEFDVALVTRLFPDFARRVNLVSGGSKSRVQSLYEALDAVGPKIGVEPRFFAVVDADRAETASPPPEPARVLQWNVYHVENHLLVDKFIREAGNAVTGRTLFENDGDVAEALREAAKQIVDELVMHRLKVRVGAELVQTNQSRRCGAGKRCGRAERFNRRERQAH